MVHNKLVLTKRLVTDCPWAVCGAATERCHPFIIASDKFGDTESVKTWQTTQEVYRIGQTKGYINDDY